MHKLAKGLKKKKKGKKSKRKDEELFKPEELEAYRREHAAGSEAASNKNEEWKNFLSLTSGVDDILKKTQDDLDRIKSTSFFQRIPPPSETEAKRKAEEEVAAKKLQELQNAAAASIPEKSTPIQFGIVQVSESESEEEDEDDIFDTTYIDAITTGEVKLAYIPESPTEDEKPGDDPFDTSIAERAILGPSAAVANKKGKKLVPIGAAVEVLTGRVQLPTCATKPAVTSNRRQILKQTDLLLDSFDFDETPLGSNSAANTEEPIKTLLDDGEIPLPDEPIDLKSNLIIKEFEEDEDDKEFEALAAESLSKKPAAIINKVLLPETAAVVVQKLEDWKPFNNDKPEEVEEITDPFDTAFAENILPGKAELKIIEKEILNDVDNDFNPRASATSNSKLTSRVPESKLNLITPKHRDLLGGSTSDLTKLGEPTILPTSEKVLNEEIKYCDPFDTSNIVDAVKAPGQFELKYLEKELLSDIIKNKPVVSKVLKTVSIDDDDFNPRALEAVQQHQHAKSRTLSRPDVLNIGNSKSVTFLVPRNQPINLLESEENSKIAKPLTPFYVRKNSVPGATAESPDSVTSENNNQDPFDTSFVPTLAPGKTELKLLENEFINNNTSNKQQVDQNFDPRDEKKVKKVAAVEAKRKVLKSVESVDLLSASSNDLTVKVLTPTAELIADSFSSAKLLYADPFDTSIAGNIPPGKAELKLLEDELIDSTPKRAANDDLLVHSGDIIIEKPLSPSREQGNSFEIEPTVEEDIDPFDTSFANNIQPGKAELKVLESELI